jgi:hypothetical protein
MKKFSRYHHLKISDDDTLDLLRFDGKLRYKIQDDTYSSLAAKTVKDDGASENYVRRTTMEMLRKKGAVLEERDGG